MHLQHFLSSMLALRWVVLILTLMNCHWKKSRRLGWYTFCYPFEWCLSDSPFSYTWIVSGECHTNWNLVKCDWQCHTYWSGPHFIWCDLCCSNKLCRSSCWTSLQSEWHWSKASHGEILMQHLSWWLVGPHLFSCVFHMGRFWSNIYLDEKVLFLLLWKCIMIRS